MAKKVIKIDPKNEDWLQEARKKNDKDKDKKESKDPKDSKTAMVDRLTDRYLKVSSPTDVDDDFDFTEFEQHPKYKEFLNKYFEGGKAKVRRPGKDNSLEPIYQPILEAIKKKPGNKLYRSDFQVAFTRWVFSDEEFNSKNYAFLKIQPK